MLADDGEHDLVCSGSNREETKVTVHPADLHLRGIAHPTPELERAVHQLPAKAPSLQFAHGGQLCHIVAFGVELCTVERGQKVV